MKNKLNKKTIGLLAVSLLMVACIGIGSALAYFTTYTEAKGGAKLDLKFQKTNIAEEVKEGNKILKVKNSENAAAAYVRIKVVVAEQFKNDLVYSEKSDIKKWTPGNDGYYYYADIVEPGAETTELYVNVLGVKATDDFNVIVIQESTPVLYKEDGTPYADWSVKADVSETVVPAE